VVKLGLLFLLGSEVKAFLYSAIVSAGTMGCTTSVVLLEGQRSILLRNCSYIQRAVEVGALEFEEETLSFRESHLWIPTTALVSPTSLYNIFAVVLVHHFAVCVL